MPKRRTRLCRLGPKFIEYIHDKMIEALWPGGDPIAKNEYRDFGLIDSATARPFQSAFGVEPYPTVPEKAAALFHSLNANHAFYNGNKRTAVVAFDIFVAVNGHYNLLLNGPMYKLAEKTASYKKRGLSHDESYREVLDTIVPQSITLDMMRRASRIAGTGAVQFYKAVMTARKTTRHLPINELID